MEQYCTSYVACDCTCRVPVLRVAQYGAILYQLCGLCLYLSCTACGPVCSSTVPAMWPVTVPAVYCEWPVCSSTVPAMWPVTVPVVYYVWLSMEQYCTSYVSCVCTCSLLRVVQYGAILCQLCGLLLYLSCTSCGPVCSSTVPAM
jgi:hypothetical protein